MSGEMEAVFNEIRARQKMERHVTQRIVRVRVMVQAIEGSIALLPLSLAEAHRCGLSWNERLPPLEILIHPVDWQQLRTNLLAKDYVPSAGDKLAGIPVLYVS